MACKEHLRVKVFLLAALLPTAVFGAENVWRGSFVAKGEEAGSFSPCQSGKRYRTLDASPEREAAQLYREVARRVGRPVFMEFIGVRDGEESLRIEKVLRVADGGPGCAESLAFVLRAHGASPTWRLDLGAEALVFQRASTQVLTWSEPRLLHAAGELGIAGDGEAGSIRVSFTPERCVDQLAGAVFSLSAQVKYEGRTYQGCAYEGPLLKEKAPR